MLKISWIDRITNEEILREVDKQHKILNKIKTRKIRYYRHLRRHNSIQHERSEGKVEAQRTIGRPPRIMWIDCIVVVKTNLRELRKAARNRKQLRFRLSLRQRCGISVKEITLH